MNEAIFATGSKLIRSTGAAVSTTIPMHDGSGYYPKHIKVSATGSGAYIKLGPFLVTATNQDLLVQAGDSVMIATLNMKYLSVISVGAASNVSVSALSTGLGSSFEVPDMFAQAEQGAWYDPSDLSTLFQDSAGTVPVTGVNQPVGMMRDKSGRGNHATQPTTVNRPVLQQDGSGKDYLAFNGTNSWLASATGAGGTAGFFFCCAAKVTGGAGTNRAIFSDLSGAAGYLVRLGTANNVELVAGDGSYRTAFSGTSPTLGKTFLLTAWHDGTALNVQVDNGGIGTAAVGPVVAGTAGFTVGADNGGAGAFFPGSLYSSVYARGTGLTAAQRATVQAHVRTKAGL